MIVYMGNVFMFMGRRMCLWEACKFMGRILFMGRVCVYVYEKACVNRKCNSL